MNTYLAEHAPLRKANPKKHLSRFIFPKILKSGSNLMRPHIDYQADCSKCADLCCLAFAFEKGQGAGVDKDPATPCPHLRKSGGCGIYQTREEMGFTACQSYDCLGAGQRVTQELFDGADWRQNDDLREDMSRALFTMKQIHETLQMLDVAIEMIPFSDQELGQIEVWLASLNPTEGWSRESFDSAIISTVITDVHRFLRMQRNKL